MFNRKTRTETRTEPRPWANILVIASVVLSGASVVWTTYSVLDLLSIGVIAVTVAATLDLVWISIQYAQHKGIPLMGSRTATEVAGWGSLAAVVGLLVWHGLSLSGQTVAGQQISSQTAVAIAIASPLLPIGAKLVMMLAVAKFTNPLALTHEEEDRLNEERRKEIFEEKQREIAEAKRKADHEAWLRAQAEEREKEKAQAEAEREKARIEHENEMARLAQQREKDAADAAAKLAAQRAQAEREKEQAKMKAELEIAEITNRNEIEMLRATSGVEIDIQRADLENDLRRRMPITIQGSAERPRAAITQRAESPVNMVSLSPAQRAKKGLAAAWYMAKANDPDLSQAQFARDNGVTAVELSRALKMFGPEDIADAS
ncbi:MAG: hypothetical protein IJI97_07715 [Clostridia bacterium]|nr:hypothetical protein [Clostridia bacterium]